MDELQGAFRRLKRRGCSVLVVGELSEPAQRQVSRRVMGAPELDRLRILVLLGRTPEADGWFPEGVSPSATGSHVIEIEDAGRSAAATVEETPPLPERPDLAGDLAERFDAILDQRDTSPGEVRVVIAPAYYDPSAGELLERLGSLMNLIDGMTYLFLPRAAVDDLDPALTDTVDALVEVRTKRAGEPEHRWILLEENLETEWIPVQP